MHSQDEKGQQKNKAIGRPSLPSGQVQIEMTLFGGLLRFI
jgi:hypothetical protein